MRLVDCFSKIFAYVLFLVRDAEEKQVPYETVVQSLDQMLVEGQAEAKHLGVSDEAFDQGRFATCAWVDETILVSNWSGRTEWAGRQLQRRFYNTANAGEEFFVRLGQFGPSRRETREILEVYAMCLALGFKGRYFSDSQQEELEEVKQKCLGGLWSPEDLEQAFPGDIIFPQAYPSRLVSRKISRAWSRFDPWLLFLAFVPPAFLISLFLVYRFIMNRSIFEFLHSSAL